MTSPSLPRPTRELNVTPMIDVLLVLLVIFMVTLPLAQRGLDLSLPADAAPPPPNAQPDSRIVLEYTADRQIAVNKRPVSLAELGATLRGVHADRRDKNLYLIGDGSLRYGEIVAVIDAARGAGVEAVGVVTEAVRRGL